MCAGRFETQQSIDPNATRKGETLTSMLQISKPSLAALKNSSLPGFVARLTEELFEEFRDELGLKALAGDAHLLSPGDTG